jgi:hypothetical protein
MRPCARQLDCKQLPPVNPGFQRGLCPGRGIEPGHVQRPPAQGWFPFAGNALGV